MRTGTIIAALGGLALVLAGVTFVRTRESLIEERTSISTQWADVDLGIQRRADLIPILIESIRSELREPEIFQSLGQARDAMARSHTPQERLDANSKVSVAIAQVVAIISKYPNLKANEKLIRLRRELEVTENGILQARRRYNDAVMSYNVHLALFPGNIVSSLAGLERDNAYFMTDPGPRSTPKV